MAVVLLVILAVLAAAAVALLALGQAPRGDGEGSLRAVRQGLAARRHPDADQRAAARAAAVEPADVSLGEMLSANVEDGAGYVQPGDLAESWQLAAARVRPGRRGHADRRGARSARPPADEPDARR